ncbi:Uncharacterised protein [uncultured archaeon]|nr:Uncharacterised protein [uncultured archaeon]
MNALTAKAELSAYWRFVRQMPVVAVEALDEDLLILNRRRRLIICEVKVSIADMRHDIEKQKHDYIYRELGLDKLPGQKPIKDWVPWEIPSMFYFGVPREIEVKAREVRDELYPYAGLLSIRGEGTPHFRGHRIAVIYGAKIIHKKPLTEAQIERVVKAQSASIANAYSKIASWSPLVEAYTKVRE